MFHSLPAMTILLASALAPANPGSTEPSATETPVTLNLDLSDISDAGGTLYIAVQTREDFMSDRTSASTIIREPAPGELKLSYSLAKGEYAVSIWHDINNNQKFDLDDQYMPLDGWSMPGADKIRAEPKFDQVKTIVDHDKQSLSLKLYYPADMQQQ